MQHSFLKTFSLSLVILVIVFFATSPAVFAAPGVPNIVSYQGRLTDNAGSLLGGSGTNYYFRFSLWTTSTIGGGSKLWPAGQPGTVTTSVVDGVFNVNIGDTASGYPDALDYNFNDSDAVYLQIEVSSDGSSFETLGPRQRIVSSGYAINAQTVAGLTPGTAANNILTLGADGEIVLSSTGISTLGDIAAGVISSGTWNGTAIGDGYFVKTGDWTGLFDGNDSTHYLNATNLTNFSTPFATAFATMDTDDLTEGATNLYSQWDTISSNINFASGNVGIANTTPGALLSLGAGTNIPTDTHLWITGNKSMRFGSDDTAGAWGSYLRPSYDAGTDSGVLTFGTREWSIDTDVMTIRDDKLGIGTTAPGELLSLGTAGSKLGVLSFAGSTSGKVIIQPAATAGTWTMTLPTDDGTDGYALVTNGSGVTSWAVSGDVVGPASSSDNAIALFDGISGSLLKNSTFTVSNEGYMTAASTQSGQYNKAFNMYVTDLQQDQVVQLTFGEAANNYLSAEFNFKKFADSSQNYLSFGLYGISDGFLIGTGGTVGMRYGLGMGSYYNNRPTNGIIATDAGYGYGTKTPLTAIDLRAPSSGLVTYPLRISNPTNGVDSSVGIIFHVEDDPDTRYGKGAFVYEGDSGIGWNRGDFHILQDSTAGTGSPDLADAVFTVKNNGNVGIGDTSPSSLFTVGTNDALQINTSGIVTSGTWNGTVIDPAYGGTGVATITGLIKGNGTSAFSAAVAGTDYEVPLTFSTGLTRTTNTITIDSSVVTLTGSQALSNKTGLISQWTNDSGYATGGGTASGTNTGDITLGAIGATPSANGASLSGQVLTLQPADASFGGIMTTGTQSIAGAKTFTSNFTVARTPDAAFIANNTSGRASMLVAGTLKSSFVFDSGGSFTIQAQTKANILTGTPSGVALFEMNSSGEVGIGGTSSATTSGVRLDVFNVVTSDSAATRTALRGRNTGSSFVTSGQAKTNYIAEFTNTATRSTGANDLTNVALYASASGAQLNYAGIFAAGNVGIGDVTPDYTLDVKGTICQDTDSDETCDGSVTSDARLKTNIESIPSALEKIRLLRGVYFDWDESNSHTAFLGRGTRQVGVIAQEIEAVFPSLVYYDSGGYRMVDYQKLAGPLIEAVKELDIQVQALPLFEDQTVAVKIEVFLRGIAEQGEAIIDTVRAKRLCAEDVCIDRDQLQNMIEYINTHQESSQPPNPNPPVEDDTPLQDDGGVPQTPGEDPEEEEVVPEPVIEPDEPVVEEVPEPEPEPQPEVSPTE